MGLPVDGRQVPRVDGGVALGGRQRGVAEQLGDGAQVAAAGQQVGVEAVAERVRRSRGRQAEERPVAPHLPLHHPRFQPKSASIAKLLNS